MVIKPAPIIPIEKEEHYVTHHSLGSVGIAIYQVAWIQAGHTKCGELIEDWMTGDWT